MHNPSNISFMNYGFDWPLETDFASRVLRFPIIPAWNLQILTQISQFYRDHLKYRRATDVAIGR